MRGDLQPCSGFDQTSEDAFPGVEPVFIALDVLFGFFQGTLIGVLGGIQSTKGAEMLLYSPLNICETQALINKTNCEQTSYNSSNLNITATNLQKTFLDDNKIKRDVEEASDDP